MARGWQGLQRACNDLSEQLGVATTSLPIGHKPLKPNDFQTPPPIRPMRPMRLRPPRSLYSGRVANTRALLCACTLPCRIERCCEPDHPESLLSLRAEAQYHADLTTHPSWGLGGLACTPCGSATQADAGPCCCSERPQAVKGPGRSGECPDWMQCIRCARRLAGQSHRACCWAPNHMIAAGPFAAHTAWPAL